MNWKKSVAIKQFFRAGASEAEACIIGKQIAEYLSGNLKGYLASCGDDADNMHDAIENLKSVNSVSMWEELSAEDPTWSDMPPLKELEERLNDFYDEADRLAIWVDPNAPEFESFELNSVGTIKVGTPLYIKGKNVERDSYERVLVKDVVNAGKESEEVIINSDSNYYFLTKSYLDNKSWAARIDIIGHP